MRTSTRRPCLDPAVETTRRQIWSGNARRANRGRSAGCDPPITTSSGGSPNSGAAIQSSDRWTAAQRYARFGMLPLGPSCPRNVRPRCGLAIHPADHLSASAANPFPVRWELRISDHFARNRPPQREQVRTRAPDDAGAASSSRFQPPDLLHGTPPHGSGQSAGSGHAELVKLENLLRGSVDLVPSPAMDEERPLRPATWHRGFAKVRLKGQRVRPAESLHDAHREIVVEYRFDMDCGDTPWSRRLPDFASPPHSRRVPWVPGQVFARQATRRGDRYRAPTPLRLR